MTKKNLTLMVSVALGILILVNFLSNRFFVRLDLTEDNQYTLGDATKDILKDLEEPITITAYFSNNLPPQLDEMKRDIRDLLVEYENYSDGMLVFEFVDPTENEEMKSKAVQEGVLPIQVHIREKDQMKSQIAFMGAVMKYGEESEALPKVTSTQGLEYTLSSAIKKLTVTDKPVIGFVQGHGEPNFGQLWKVKQELNTLYKTELVQMNDSVNNLNKYSTIIITNPTDSFSAPQLKQLDEFLASGGSALFAINLAGSNAEQSQMTYPINTGLVPWLAQKGISMDKSLIIDENCLQVGVQLQNGFMMPVAFPYFVQTTHFSDHAISSGLESAYFQFVSPINQPTDSALNFTPIVTSSKNSGIRPAQGYVNPMYEWSEKDFTMQELIIGAAIEGDFGSGTKSKIIVFGDGDFALSGSNQQSNVESDNINLLINSVDWLTDETGLVELRTEKVTARPIEELEDSKRAFLKYFNFLLPIFLTIVYGIIRFQRKRIRRLKRMEEGYV